MSQVGLEDVRVARRDLHKVLDDNAHLKDQVQRLQEALNEARAHRRGLRYQVHDFHQAMGQPVLSAPQVPRQARIRLRLKLIAEEFFELMRAAGVETGAAEATLQEARLAVQDAHTVDLPELVDAMADLDYVVEGTRLEFGVDGWPIACEVQRSNMAKVGASRDDDGKILKPPGWTPPDIEGCLREQGWEG